MRYLVLLCLLSAFMPSAMAKDENIMCTYQPYSDEIKKNPAIDKSIYQPKTTYHLQRLDTGDVRTYKDTETLANLLFSDGAAPVLILHGEHGALKDLTAESAEKIFGKPSFRGHSERVPSEELFTFDLKGFGPRNEPDIFHIDLEAGASGKVKSYRVRGVDIPKPSWQELGLK